MTTTGRRGAGRAERPPEAGGRESHPLETAPSLRLLLVLLLTFAFLPAGGVAIYSSLNAYESASAVRDRGLLQHLRGAIRDKRVALATVRRMLAQEAALGRIDTPALADAAACRARLGEIAATDEWIRALQVLDRSGAVRCAAPVDGLALDQARKAGEQALATPQRNRVSIIQGASPDDRMVTASHPLSEGGALIATLDIQFLGALRGPDAPPGFLAMTTIRAGDPNAGVDENLLAGNEWAPNAALLRALASEEPATMRGVGRNGKSYIYASAALAEDEILALAAWPVDMVSVGLETQALLGVALPVSAWILSVGVVIVVLRYLVLDHLESLQRAMSLIGAGDRSNRAELPETAPSEFRALGHHFDQMADRLEERERLLEKSLGEQRLLLKEVYHRVKNNLQLIVSLLNMQLRKTKNQEQREIIQRTQARVEALALVHQNLYAAGRLSEVRLDELLREIAPSLGAIRGGETSKLRFDYALEAVAMDAEQASPAALFASEAITNAVKHAPVRDDAPPIRLVLSRVGDDGFAFTVANAIDPLPGGLKKDPLNTGLGSQLMRGFARQLRGTVDVKQSDDWYEVSLHVPETPKNSVRYETSVSDQAGEI